MWQLGAGHWIVPTLLAIWRQHEIAGWECGATWEMHCHPLPDMSLCIGVEHVLAWHGKAIESLTKLVPVAGAIGVK